jgi:hypothetical protein
MKLVCCGPTRKEATAVSRKTFTLYFISLLAAGLVGFWLTAFGNSGNSTPKAVAGLALMLASVVGFVVVFRRELRTTEVEKMAEWEEARAQGRRGFVLSQVRGALTIMLLSSVAVASVGYSPGRPLGEGLLDLAYLLWAVPACAALVALWSLAWWNWQEKRYAGHA